MDHKGIIADLVGALPRSEGRILDVAAKWLREGDAEYAVLLLRTVNQTHSTLPIRIALARALLAAGDARPAMADMVGILRDQPENTEALLVLTDALIECAEYERAQRMLDRASKVGAPPFNVNQLQSRLDSLTGQTGRIDASILDPKDERRSTIMGGPNVSPFDIADPLGQHGAVNQDVTVDDATVESGTFTDLDSYMILPDDLDETMIDQQLSSIQDDVQFDSILQTMGVAVGEKPSADQTQAYEPNPELARPDDQTMGLVVDSSHLPGPGEYRMTPTASGVITSAPKFAKNETATPNEPTQAMAAKDYELSQHTADPDEATSAMTIKEFESQENANEATAHITFSDEMAAHATSEEFQQLPSVEYDPGFLADVSSHAEDIHTPPSDLDNLPNFDATMSGRRHEIAKAKTAFTQMPHDLPPARQESKPVAPQNFNQAYGQPAPPPQAVRQEPRKVEPTQGSASRPSASKSGPNRLPLVVGVVVGVLVIGMGALAFVSASQKTSALNSARASAEKQTEADSYAGYLSAYNVLDEALKETSFMGAGFDNTVHPLIPIASMQSSEVRKQILADHAFVAATIEARFEEPGTKNAKETVARAMESASGFPQTTAAAALLNLALGQPQEALSVLDDAPPNTQNAPVLKEAQVLVYGALDRPKSALTAGDELATIAEPTLRNRYFVGLSKRLSGNRDALSIFSDILDENPAHVDSIIERSYLLREGASELKRAETELTNLPSTDASQYQQARAATALGDLMLHNGKEDAAEEKFRDAIRRMPSRTELYEPLLEFYFKRGRYDDAKTFIEKAETEGHSSSQLAIRHAELLVLTSEPLKALDVLNKGEFNDARKDWLRGLAYYFLHKHDDAIKAFEEGEEKSGEDYPAPSAFKHLVRATQNEANIADAIHQIERLKGQHPTDAMVSWALAKTFIQDALRTPSRTKREERLKKAKDQLREASKQRPDFPVFHYELCEIYLLQLDEAQAEKQCAKGRKMTKDYVPGMVVTAKLRLQQGAFKQAYDELKPLADRRSNDPVIGLLLARAAIEQRRIDEARKQLDKWVGNDQVDEFQMQLLEGRTQFAQEQYTRAVGYLEKAYDLKKDDGEAAVFYAHTLTRLGRHKDALKVVRNAKQHPIWGGYADLVEGEANRRRNNLKRAGDAYARAKKWFKQKNKPIPTYQIAVLYTEMALAAKQRLGWGSDEVRKLFTEARTAGDVTDPYLNFHLGRFYLNQAKPDLPAATKAFERTVSAIPNHCAALDALIKIYEKTKSKKDLAATQKKFKAECK